MLDQHLGNSSETASAWGLPGWATRVPGCHRRSAHCSAEGLLINGSSCRHGSERGLLVFSCICLCLLNV